jgi:hypothetical protein
MLHYENDDYECAADPFCPPPFPISERSDDYMPGYDDGEWDGYMSEADLAHQNELEVGRVMEFDDGEVDEDESDYMPGRDDGEWDDHEDMCGEEDFA